MNQEVGRGQASCWEQAGAEGSFRGGAAPFLSQGVEGRVARRAGLSNQGWQAEQNTLCLSCCGSVLSNENPQQRVRQEGRGPALALPLPCSLPLS